MASELVEVPVYLEDHNKTITLVLTTQEAELVRRDVQYLQIKVNEALASMDSLEVVDKPTTQLSNIEDRDNDDEGSRFAWSHDAILGLLDIYSQNKYQFSLGKKKTQKIWEEIAQDLRRLKNNDVTAKQVQAKISGLKRTYSDIKGKHGKGQSGKGNITWPYFKVMDEVFGQDHWVASPNIATSDGPTPSTSQDSTVLSPMDENKENLSRPRKRKVEAVLEQFIHDIRDIKEKERNDRINREKEKEATKQKRHEEKLELQKALIEVLKQSKQ